MNSRERNSILAVDFIAPFIAIFGVVMFLPVLSSLQKTFGVTISEISWLPNIGYLTMILFSPVVGILIKKFGIKPLLLTFVFLWVGGISIEIISISILKFPVFVMGRFIEALGEASIFPLMLSMNKVVLNSEDLKKSSSLMEIGGTVGGFVAAIISGHFVENPARLFFIPIVLGIIIFVFILLNIKNAQAKEESSSIKANAKESNKVFISLLIMIFTAQGFLAAIQVYLVYYLESFRAAGVTGTIISFEQILSTIGTILPVLLLKKMSFKRIRNLIFLVFIISAVLVGMHLSVGIASAFLVLTSLFIGIAFTTLNIFLSKSIHRNVSKKMSLYTAVRFSGGFAVSFIWGRLIEVYTRIGYDYAKTFKILYISIGVIALALAIVTIILQKDEAMLEKEELMKKGA